MEPCAKKMKGAFTVLLVALLGITCNFCTVQCYNCYFISQDTGTISVRQDVSRDSRFRKCWDFSVGNDYELHLKITQFDIVTEYMCYTSTQYPYWKSTPSSTGYPYWKSTPSSTGYPYWKSTPSSMGYPYWKSTPSTEYPYWWTSTPSSTGYPYWKSTPSSTGYPYWKSTPSTQYPYWKSTTQYPHGYNKASLIIQDDYNDVNYTFNPLNFNRNIIVRGDARITLEVDNRYNWCLSHKLNFRLEISNVSGIEPVEGMFEARDKIVTWMRRQLSPPLKWHDDIEKTVIALHLGGGMNFSETGLFEELLIKQLDLKSSVALLRNKLDTVSLVKLAKIINSLLVTCHNPRKFYGFDLIEIVKEKLEETSLIPSPLVYIALCNANETLKYQEIQKLLNNFQMHKILLSEYPFSSDMAALVFMALSCIRTQDNEVREDTQMVYNETLTQLKMLQQDDGSFGNIYSTAILTQALMSSNADNQSLLNDTVLPAVKFLINHLNTSDFGLMAAYYSLPILNEKTLLDIRHTDCSRNPRMDKDGSDISDNLGEKIKVKYSLIIGDKEDVSNTLTLRVPDSTTAYKLMLLAQATDHKYKFEWKRMSGKMYVYEIAGIPVDPEEGRFWLTYLKNNISAELNSVSAGPDKLLLHDGYHLIHWYKSVHF